MKNFTVSWWEAADDELLRLWLDFPAQRQQITDASREIDRLLISQADTVGDSVHEGLFALEIAPLKVQFSVEADDRIVRVWTVRLINLPND